MTMLAELVDVVIGVDTHKHTHTAAVVAAATGGLVAETDGRDRPGRLPAAARLADRHAGLAGVVDRGHRRLRRRPDPLPGRARRARHRARPPRARRPAATAPSPTRSTPSAPPAKRSPASSWPSPAPAAHAGRAGGAAGRPPFRSRRLHRRPAPAPAPSSSPPPSRSATRFRGQSHRHHGQPPAHGCAGHASWDVETAPPRPVLRDLARRMPTLDAEARDHTSRPSSRSSSPGGPTCSTSSASARSSPPPCCAPGPTPAASATKPRSPCSPAPRRSPPPRATRTATGSTAAATASSTAPCTRIVLVPAALRPRHPRLRRRRRPKARPTARSCAASLDEYRCCDPEPGSWLLGRRQGTASLLCRQTASFSPAAPGAPRPCRPASGTCPIEGRTMKNRRQGLDHRRSHHRLQRRRPDVRRLGLGQRHP